jgi:hypothetical protein
MSIIKSLACALLFVVHATNAEIFVNCMADPDARPEGPECTNVKQEVLDMLSNCTGSPMQYVGIGSEGPPHRLLGSREQEHQTLRGGEVEQSERDQSERDLQLIDWACFGRLNAGQRMMCCLLGNNGYSFCGEGRLYRRLQEDALLEPEVASITDQCTDNFKALAEEYVDLQNDGSCLGSPDNVFCETLQVITG